MAVAAGGEDAAQRGRDLEVVRLGRGGQQRARRLGEIGRPASSSPSAASTAASSMSADKVRRYSSARSGVSASVMGSARGYPSVPLSKIAWLTTVGICLITCVLLLLSGYLGYAGVLLAVALSAAINLR